MPSIRQPAIVPTACMVALVAIIALSLSCQRAATADPADKSNGQAANGDSAAKDGTNAQPKNNDDSDAVADGEHPFPRRFPAPSLDGGVQWLNAAGPIELKDLRGKFVLLDFWTYCCINCMHILPELKKLEHAYPNELVVIGVHSAKFETENGSENIRQAILRHEIEHPVVNDAEHVIWRRYGISGWPALRIIDPQGNLVAGHGGEIDFESLDGFLKTVLPYYKKRKLLDESPIRFDLESLGPKAGALRFPGKVLADQSGERLFIADSGHNRIVITDMHGKLIDTIGTGKAGAADGSFQEAAFDHPQGMALADEMLYVADTENHLLRKINLAEKTVSTIAGTGKQNRGMWPGMDRIKFDEKTGEADFPDRWVGKPRTTPIASPWAVHVHGGHLYIAMAGPHQIWRMTLDESEIEVYAGNGREDIIDGQLVPETPPRIDPSGYESDYSSFAQPSGFASDGEWLYVADTEGSSIRAIPFDRSKKTKTIVGTADLPGGRLFVFGDRDGKGLLQTQDQFGFTGDPESTTGALLQHAIGVTYNDGVLYVADTYNNKIKVIDLATADCTTLVGTGEPGGSDNPAKFDEPAGISYAAEKLFVADTNNHAIRIVHLEEGNRVSTLSIDGLKPPKPTQTTRDLGFDGAKQINIPAQEVTPAGGKIRLKVNLELPPGWKINTLGPMRYLVEARAENGLIDRKAIGNAVVIDKASRKANFDIELPLSAGGQAGQKDALRVSLTYFYCRDGAEGVCKFDTVAWEVPLTLVDEGKETISLPVSVTP